MPKVEEAIVLTEREAVNAIGAYDQMRREAKRFGDSQADIGKHLKKWFEANPRYAELTNGELNLKAYMQERQAADTYDVASTPPALVLWLAAHGCLSMDVKALAALRGKFAEVDETEPYKMPGKPSTALQVVPSKE